MHRMLVVALMAACLVNLVCLFGHLHGVVGSTRGPDERSERPDYKASTGLVRRRRDAHLVEARGVHRINLAYQDVGRHLVLGAAKFSEGGQQGQIIERLERQRQPWLPSGFRVAPFFKLNSLQLKHGYNIVKTLGRRLES